MENCSGDFWYPSTTDDLFDYHSIFWGDYNIEYRAPLRSIEQKRLPAKILTNNHGAYEQAACLEIAKRANSFNKEKQARYMSIIVAVPILALTAVIAIMQILKMAWWPSKRAVCWIIAGFKKSD